MIRLHPIPDVVLDCPHCQMRLTPAGWRIPGMRSLARLKCGQCKRDFFADLPVAHGLYYPMLLDSATGAVHDRYEVPWFANWLRTSFASRATTPVTLTEEARREVRRPLLLNCLDRLYGHCLLKLLNAQHYLDRHRDLDLIVLIPRSLRWLVPDGVAAIWSIDWSLRACGQWNDRLAAELHNRLSTFEEAWLSVALPHPHPDDVTIERFTRTAPFPINEWHQRLEKPTVTFIWRDDRTWNPQSTIRCEPAVVMRFAEALREQWPALDLAVAGLGEPAGLPGWITDLRRRQVDVALERGWCERYAASHVVVGVHGSNMLLPSAHAGATIELVPPDRWPNVFQDLLPQSADVRDALFRYRAMATSSTPEDVAAAVSGLLAVHDEFAVRMSSTWARHGPTRKATDWQGARRKSQQPIPGR